MTPSLAQSAKRLLLEPPARVAPADYRTFAAFSIGAAAAFLIHLAVLPLFWAIGATELLWLNIFSESAYVASWLVNRRGRHVTMIAICTVELCVHQACCVWYIGWDTGFQYYLFVLPAFLFFLPKGSARAQWTLLILTAVEFAGLRVWSQTFTPVHTVSTAMETAIAAFNVTAVLGLLSLFAYSYQRAAETAEQNLAAHERRLADERLLLLRAAVAAAQDVIIITDARGDIEFANEAVLRVAGHAPADIVGKNVRLLKSGEHASSYYADLWSDLRDGKCWSGRIINRRKDGTFYTVRATITPVFEEGGRVHYLAIEQDVTKAERERARLKHTEEQLRQAKKLEALGALAGGIAHDFNNLLTAILGNADCVLNALPPDDPSVEDVQEIRKAGERAATMTRQLLAYSRNLVLAPQVVDPNGVVLEAEKLLRRTRTENVDLVLRLAPDVHRIEVDETQFVQVLLNLTVNAKDAMPDGGRLVLQTENATFPEPVQLGRFTIPDGTYVVITVSDTGLGMSPEIAQRIFEPFFTTKPPGRGTGLGLATVYGIVSQSGGHITVHSEPGVGTTFKVFLPSTLAAVSVATETHAPEPSGGNETVLCVEDDESVRLVTVRLLRTCGYRVLEASNGQHALEHLASHDGPIDLVVTDVMMEGLDGPTLARQVKAKAPEIEVIFVSGYSPDVIRRHGDFIPGVNFLSKPFASRSLVTLVRQVLDARVARRAPEKARPS